MYRRRASPSRKPDSLSNVRPKRQTQPPGESAKVTLPPSWSGFVTIGESLPPPPALNFKMGLYSLNPESQFRGIIFRSNLPIREVRPFGIYGANKDALQSLQSLDSRLKRELSGHGSDPKQSSSHLQRSGESLEFPRSYSIENSSTSRPSERDCYYEAPRQLTRQKSKQDTDSNVSSLYLDLSALDSSINQPRSANPFVHHNISRAPSVFSDNYDNYSKTHSAPG